MIDITTISTEKLQSDLGESLHDIMVCELAIEHRVFVSFSEFEIAQRLDTNRRIVKKIRAELERRGVSDD